MKSGEIRAIGIDLETTNSAVTETVWDPASGELPALRTLEIDQQTREGLYMSPLVPSVVAILPDGRHGLGGGGGQASPHLPD